MSASAMRDKIAVVVAIAGGLLFCFLATQFGQTGHLRIVPAAFVFLFLPVVVVVSERLKCWCGKRLSLLSSLTCLHGTFASRRFLLMAVVQVFLFFKYYL
jgi:hypothetical protein